ncbi:hypothetical protein GQ43DRAFT_470399 [Delitschia confertaspora ATCC 74209]|uniref:Uncharacterized protein n=1 Tax=Delitschia confertaspora ATCC 74209 TaxID=1513339 RepID=A0A9P4JTK4_9PLEO|nr:hypothetical protein GQ43DRAFT_470399 [Delitschia confertaspora ATCC 74209]
MIKNWKSTNANNITSPTKIAVNESEWRPHILVAVFSFLYTINYILQNAGLLLLAFSSRFLPPHDDKQADDGNSAEAEYEYNMDARAAETEVFGHSLSIMFTRVYRLN